MKTPARTFENDSPRICAGLVGEPARPVAPARPGPRAKRRVASACLALGILALVPSCNRSAPQPSHDVVSPTPRIVSLAPSLTEIVCAVGAADRLVGRTDVCNYPSNLLVHVSVVGGFGRPYLEPLLAQKPTLVLDVDLEDKSLGATFERLGIGHQHIACRRLADIPPAVRTIGRLAGRSDAGNALARSIELGIRNRRAVVEQLPPDQRPLVYVEIWGDPQMTAGRNSFVSELVALAGGRNMGDELANDYGTVSTEWVLTRNPTIILCLYPNADHRARKAVASRLGWQTLRAVQNGRVYDDFNLDTILRPGPRVLDGVEQLRRAIAESILSPASLTHAVENATNLK